MYDIIVQLGDMFHHMVHMPQIQHIGDFTIIPKNNDYIIYYFNEATHHLRMVGIEDTQKHAIEAIKEIKINIRAK
jgi:hypothetical protein